MALKTILTTLDDVDSDLHQHYAEQELDGKTVFVLQVSGVDSHPDVRGLKTALLDAKTKRDKNGSRASELESKIAELEERLEGLPEDFSVEMYNQLREGGEKFDIGKLRQEVEKTERNRYERELEKVQRENAEVIGRLTKYEDHVKRTTVETELSSSLDSVGVDPKYKKAVLALLQSKGDVKFVEEDGQFQAWAETDMGQIEVARYVRNWADSEDGKPFVAPPRGGDEPGTSRTTGQNLGENPFAKQNWSKTAQQALMRSDRSKAERSARAAGFRDLDSAVKAFQPNN